MIVNFKAAREISRGVRKLTRTPTLIKKKYTKYSIKEFKIKLYPKHI
jgi:hypothetical protein